MKPLLLFVLVLLPVSAHAVEPLARAHAHNDYEHPRPLFDALDQGFCSVEADIFLVNKQLLVAHTVLSLKPERTLQKLYLDPLRERAKANGGNIHKNAKTFWLMIDVKTEAKPTFAALSKVLEEYADILTVAKDGKTEARAVTILISGNCDRDAILAQKTRFAAIDGRPKDLDGTAPADVIPWVSTSWSSMFKWNGEGPMPSDEAKKLKEYVAKAHQQKRVVRFWGTPDRPSTWETQYTAGVDLINTDQLKELREFLLKQAAKR